MAKKSNHQSKYITCIIRFFKPMFSTFECWKQNILGTTGKVWYCTCVFLWNFGFYDTTSKIRYGLSHFPYSIALLTAFWAQAVCCHDRLLIFLFLPGVVQVFIHTICNCEGLPYENSSYIFWTKNIYFANKHGGLNGTTEKHAFLKLVDRVRFPLWVTQQTWKVYLRVSVPFVLPRTAYILTRQAKHVLSIGSKPRFWDLTILFYKIKVQSVNCAVIPWTSTVPVINRAY